MRLPRAVYSQVEVMYFVTVCCREKIPYFANENVAECAFQTWREVVNTHRHHVWALCVMPDHLHTLIELRNEKRSLSATVSTAKSLSATRSRGMGALRWQDRFHDHVMRKDEDFRVRARYLAENPVRQGLVETWNEWPWTYLDDVLGW